MLKVTVEVPDTGPARPLRTHRFTSARRGHSAFRSLRARIEDDSYAVSMSLAVVKRTVYPRLSACCATFFKIMILPMAVRPTRTVLCPDLTKFSSPIASVSIFLGQVQSKSTIGLAAPAWASRMRRSRPRFWRSRSSMASTSCSHGLSMICSQQAINPNAAGLVNDNVSRWTGVALGGASAEASPPFDGAAQIVLRLGAPPGLPESFARNPFVGVGALQATAASPAQPSSKGRLPDCRKLDSLYCHHEGHFFALCHAFEANVFDER